VTAAPGSRVGRVVLGGYHRQAVQGLPADVPVMEMFHEGRGAEPYLDSLYTLESPRLRPLVQALYRLTRLDVASFQGGYRTDPSKAFVVDKVQDDPRPQADFPLPDAAGLPKLTFEALRLTPVSRASVSAAVGTYSRDGPV